MSAPLDPRPTESAEVTALRAELADARRLALALARGDLGLAAADVHTRGPTIGSLKALHSSLRHLTWQTQRIAEGDLSQRVDFLGEFSESFNEMVRQLSERKKLELQLRQSQKLEAVGQLAGGLAHELNTPAQFVGDNLHFLGEAITDLLSLLGDYRAALDAIAGTTRHQEVRERLRDAEETIDVAYLAERAPKAAQAAREGVARIATIVQAMKIFARPDHPGKGPADLNEALQATVTVAHDRYATIADVELELGELPRVTCHIGELNQVFLALISNAAHAIEDATATRGGRGHIRVKTSAAGGAVRVEISDDGCGIPEAIRERIFEPFFSTKEVGRGSGQGLATARAIVVDQHQGSLSFESRVGEGTTFILELPIEPAP